MAETRRSLEALERRDDFQRRHIGPTADEQAAMLQAFGLASIDALIDKVVPPAIRMTGALALDPPVSEQHALADLRAMADANQVFRSFIGMGYHGTVTPPVVLRNVLENPAWYTAYTPYQPEISQGRLEALLTFQTMVTDLTGLDIANASLLDEATAAAEAMTLCLRHASDRPHRFFVARDCLPQTIDVVRTRARPLGIEVVVGDPLADLGRFEGFGVLLQYPGVDGDVVDHAATIREAKAGGALVVMAADLLALTLLKPPGELGADVAVGSTQRFGVPMGYGGPHAAYMATRDAYKRSLPGRLVGVSVDARGRTAYRLALQTREQHIRREKATSNICTAQVLLAVIAALYACWHGPDGLRTIAERVHRLTGILAAGLRRLGLEVRTGAFFDTVTVATGGRTAAVHQAARAARMNLREVDQATVGVTLDQTTTRADVEALWRAFAGEDKELPSVEALDAEVADAFPASLRRESAYLAHPVFTSYRSETDMLRYLRRLADKDVALDRSMIPLGSCTMKLNATTEMIPITWPGFAGLHPFAPSEQARGYAKLCGDLERMLAAATGYDAVSLQPNAGSQGEYAGLLAIKAWHESRGEGGRTVCLIPSSAHGTNPASAQMAGMDVVVVGCDAEGNVDLADLEAKAAQHTDRLAALMVTYPSTHGVFEEGIGRICEIVHRHGGQVYMDGANLNALVGLVQPGRIGPDVSHINLHKTFCIPHGGGGPGVGPIAVRSHLAPFLPGHRFMGGRRGEPVSAAPYGSAGILPISWAYIRMMGAEGLRRATEVAILAANYVAKRLAPHYPVLYAGREGYVAHECILDLRPLKETSGVTVDDVAKRLADYGFHAPTMSFPVAGTLMIEPTESEPKAELDRFVDAMIAIREEIRAIERGEMSRDDNPLKGAPHTAAELLAEEWTHPYSREQAAYPLPSLRAAKYWPPVARIDAVYGDRHLFCACPPPESWSQAAE